MPLVAAAVCPHPPLLVPRFAGAAASELDGLRAACRQAIALVLGASPDEIVVVGSGPRTETYATGARGALGPWGVPQLIALGAPGSASPPAEPELPLSITIGAWLLGVPPRPVRGQAVAVDATPADCLALGAELAATGRIGLLVMGDGSACRTEKAPGYLRPEAAPFDAHVAAALAAGDVAALAALDLELCDELRCAGRAPWQVLAGAAGAGVPPRRRVHYDDAPYGVGYLVASWS
jgi:hypothetical protein